MGTEDTAEVGIVVTVVVETGMGAAGEAVVADTEAAVMGEAAEDMAEEAVAAA